jgi:ribosomal-protein-alanine N-acetyltransferase
MQNEFLISTKRCNIRGVKISDDEQILSAMACPEISSMHSGGFQDIASVRSYINVLIDEYSKGIFKTLAITDKNTDTLLGCITIDTHKYFPRAELGYWIAIPYRNKGFMTEAIQAIIKYGLTDLGLVRIQAYHSVDNPASGRVLEKAGMKFEGVMRLYNGRFDENMYAIINTDLLC